jgi:hypothetical protein
MVSEGRRTFLSVPGAKGSICYPPLLSQNCHPGLRGDPLISDLQPSFRPEIREKIRRRHVQAAQAVGGLPEYFAYFAQRNILRLVVTFHLDFPAWMVIHLNTKFWPLIRKIFMKENI